MTDAFVDAAACGDLKDVERLLQDKSTTSAQVNAIDKDGRSALHYACLNDDIPLLHVLLNDERTNVGLCTPKGDCVVHMAALYASLEALKVLFKDPRASKLINAKNKYGETALHLCAGSGDKGAKLAADILLDAGASMVETDQWMRGPLDVAHDNGENPMVEVFESWLECQTEEMQVNVASVRAQCLKEKGKKLPEATEEAKASRNLLVSSFNLQLGSTRNALKKVSVTEKHMFSSKQGQITKLNTGTDVKNISGKALSKLIDFPGNVEEIKGFLKDPKIDPAGKDAFGLSALQKFASWNKTELIDLILPRLTVEQINSQDLEGKTAL